MPEDYTKKYAPTPPLAILGQVLTAIAVVATLACIIGGIALIAHTDPTCVPSDDPSFAPICDGSTHPFTAWGWITIIGGIIQGAFLLAFARVTVTVANIADKLKV